MQEKRMPGIRLYCSELDLMERLLSAKEMVLVLRALRLYVAEGIEIELSGAAQACFEFLRGRIDADIRAYRETCERNRLNAEKRWALERRTVPDRGGYRE